jgi:putative transposase
MKKSKFSEAQIAFILRQADEGTPVAEVCRKAGISDATFYNWRKRYGGLTPSEVKRMRQLEDENNRLKKIVADLIARQGDAAGRPVKKALKPARRRRLVDEVREDWKVSIRRACACLRIDTSLYHYKSKRGDQAALKARIKEIAATRVRYGYRRVHVSAAPGGLACEREADLSSLQGVGVAVAQQDTEAAGQSQAA